MSSQPHVPAVLPRVKRCWVGLSEPICTFWSKEKSFQPVSIRTPDHPVRCLVTLG